MFDEYNHQIIHRADQLPITKINYRVNSSKEATTRITRANDPLNVTMHESLKAKFEWVLTQARALGIPPPPELSSFRILRNIIPPPRIKGRKGLVIKEPKSGAMFYSGNFDLAFQREEEFHLATTP
ncbi:hypothetical protein Tco_0643426 [Tanacetum coccineum]